MYYYQRSDGLMRGSREDREEQMLGLQDAPWNLDTLLDLVCGFLDHAEDVRIAAMEALQGIAVRNPAPLQITPVFLILHYMDNFTTSSGVLPQSLKFLLHSGLPGTYEIFKDALARIGNNECFQKLVDDVLDSGDADLVGYLKGLELSKTKAQILRAALMRRQPQSG